MPATTAPKKAPSSLASVRSWMSDATQNRFVAVVLAMLVAVPLLATANSNMTGLSALTLELFALVLMTMLLWRARFDFSADSVRQFLTTGANAPVLLLVALVAVSTAFSPVQVFSVQQLLAVGAGAMLYFVVGYQFRQSKHLSMLSSTILFLGGLVAFAGLATYQMDPSMRAGKLLLGDPQPLASMLMVLLPVVGALAFTDKNQGRARVAQFVAALMIGALLATQVRTAWVASFFSLGTLAFLAMRPVAGQSTKRASFAASKHNFAWPVMFVVIALGFAYAVTTLNGSIGSRATTFAKLGNDISWQARLQEQWSGACQMIAAKPLTGWSPGSFPVFQGKFTHQGVQNIAAMSHSMFDQAHNFYLQTAAELGLPGLALTVAMLVAFLVTGFKRVGSMEAGIRRTLLIGSLAAVVGFMVDAIASPSWQYSQVAMFMWLMMGIGTSCFRPRAKAVKAEEVAVAPFRRASLFTRPVAVAMCLGLATLLPSVQICAAAGYNPNDDASDGLSTGEKIAIGVTVFAGGYYIIDQLMDKPENNNQ